MINSYDIGSYHYTELDNLEGITERLSGQRARDVSRLIADSLTRANEENGAYSSRQLNALIALLNPERVRETSDSGYTVLVSENQDLIASGMLVNKEYWWEVKTLYVDSERQGQGIGSRVIGMLEEKARDKGAEDLYVEAGSFPATIEFYKSRDYEFIMPYPQAYRVMGQNLEFTVMEKTLR